VAVKLNHKTPLLIAQLAHFYEKKIMNNTIKCKHCGKEIEISEALQHKIEEQVLAIQKEKHQQELAKVKRQAEQEAVQKLQKDFETKIQNLEKEKEEEKERSKKFLKELSTLNEEMRKLRRRDEERELEMVKRLSEEEGVIRQEAKKKAFEEHELKDREREKQLADVRKANEELKRKLEQGSQQTQGEALELELEEVLKKAFPADKITEVKKGQRGADVIQEVLDKKGKSCGAILWESKNAKWSSGWITKLKEDQRWAKAHLAVLLVSNPPEGLRAFTYKSGIWITTRKMIIPLAQALRFDLIRLNYERLSNVGKNEKMEILYQYITSMEFKHRIEAIVEAFGGLQEEMEREKRYFQTKWARQDKQLRKIIDHTQGMYGDLEATVGKSLPGIKTLQIDSGETR
jgi:hypothetical protein